MLHILYYIAVCMRDVSDGFDVFDVCLRECGCFYSLVFHHSPCGYVLHIITAVAGIRYARESVDERNECVHIQARRSRRRRPRRSPSGIR